MKLESAVRMCRRGAKRSLEVIVTYDDRKSDALWYKDCFSQFCEAWANDAGVQENGGKRAFFKFGPDDLPEAISAISRVEWRKVKICAEFSSCASISYLAWVDSDGAIVPKPNPNSEANKHRLGRLEFPGLETIFDEATGADNHIVSFVGYRELGAHEPCEASGTIGAADILGLPKHCPCTWLYAEKGGKHHTFNAGVFILKLPQASPLISMWMGLMPATVLASEQWAGESSEQWAFDSNLAHSRCVKLVKEVDFAVRSPVFRAKKMAPFVHFYGANAFHGKRDIRCFCKHFVQNIGRPTLLEEFSEAVKLAAEYDRTSETVEAMNERARMAKTLKTRQKAIAKARTFKKSAMKAARAAAAAAKKRPAAKKAAKKKPAMRRS